MSGSRLPGDSASTDRHRDGVRAETRLSGSLAERFSEYRESHGVSKSDLLREALDAFLPASEHSEYVLPRDPALSDAYLALAGDDQRTIPVETAEDILARNSHPNTPKQLLREEVLDPLDEQGFIGVSNGHVVVRALTPREEIGDRDRRRRPMTTLEAQGLCRGCWKRYLFLADPETQTGMTVQTNHYCECEEPQPNVVAVVYEPDLYELVDTYGDGAIGLRATCEGCDADLYGPVTECPACGCETFDRWLEGDRNG